MMVRHRHTARTWPLWFAALCLLSLVVGFSTLDIRTQNDVDSLASPAARAIVGRWFAAPLDSVTEPLLPPGSRPDDACARERTVDYAYTVAGQLVFTDDCLAADGSRMHQDGAVAWADEAERSGSVWGRWRQSLHALYEQLHALAGPVHEVVAVDDALGLALVAVAGSDDVLLLSRQQRVDPAAVKRFLQRLREDDARQRPLA